MIPASPIETYCSNYTARRRIADLEAQVGQYREALATAVGLLGECRPSASYPGYILGPRDGGAWFARRDALLTEVGKMEAK